MEKNAVPNPDSYQLPGTCSNYQVSVLTTRVCIPTIQQCDPTTRYAFQVPAALSNYSYMFQLPGTRSNYQVHIPITSHVKTFKLVD